MSCSSVLEFASMKLCAWCGEQPVKVPAKSDYCSLQCFGKARAARNRAGQVEPPPVPGAVWIPLAKTALEGRGIRGEGRGGFALVDEADATLVRQYAWARGGAHGQYATSRNVYMHRMLMTGVEEIDHRNGNGLDNRRANLRAATHQENAWNMRARAKVAKYRGISFHGPSRTWNARISTSHGKKSLGYFATQEEAARAYDDAARLEHGEFACVNFPRDGERGALR